MRKHLVYGMMLIVLSLFMSGCLFPSASKEPPAIVDVQGSINDLSGVVSDLTVTLAGKTTETSSTGIFEFEEIPSGNHVLTVYRDNQGIHAETVTIARTDTVLEIDLYVTNWTHEVGDWDETFEEETFKITNYDDETGATNAYAVIDQPADAKKITYEWSVKFHDGNGSAGMHVMAQSGEDSQVHGGSYLVFHSNTNYLRLYRATEDGSLNSRISPIVEKDDVSVHDYLMELNSETGKIDIYYNGRHIGDWTDPDPYTEGQFIALRTNGTGATFSNVKVTIEQ